MISILFTGAKMLDRNARINRHLKANRQTLKKGLPASSEGSNGDITIREVNGNTQQYVKKNGKWDNITGVADSSAQKTIIVKASGAGTSASSSASASNHSDLDNLSNDDHSQYTHNTIARTVSAAHSFTGNPSFSNIDINGGAISGITDLAVADGGTGASSLDNLITLGTHTTGNYMSQVSGNSQITVSHTQGEGSTASLSIAADSIGDTQLTYNTGQHLTTGAAVTFASVNTGQGPNELYDMDQNVLTTSDVTFDDIVTTGDIIVGGDDITSDPFTSGFPGGGWKIDNTGHAEFGSASIRGTLSVYELLLQQLRATNGSVIITAVAKVESIDGSDITFEDPSDNGVCPFHTNDIVMVQRADITGSSSGDNGGGTLNVIRRLVRRVTSVSGRTITVSSAEDGDLPADTGSFGVGDDVVRIGNTTNTNRDAILYLSADDSKAPYLVIKDGGDRWANWGNPATEKVRLGRLDGVTDTDAGLTGSESNLYGLYSDSVYLKGHIFANSGSIGGISMASSKLHTGTGTHGNANTGFYIDSSSNFSLGSKLTWNGSTLTIDGGGTFSGALSAASGTFAGALSAATGTFSGTVSIGGVDLNATNTLNENTTKTDVDLNNVVNESPSTLKTTMALNNVDNTSDDSVLGTAATAANNATKTSGYVGGWEISDTAILGVADGEARIVMTADGNIVTDEWAINRDGSASFADGGITFATNGDITSNTYLIERTRLFGGGEDSYNGSSYVDTWISTSSRSSAWGENTYAICVAPETADEISNGYNGVANIGPRIMYRDTTKWYMQSDAYFNDFTVKTGVILHTRGYRIFCKGTFTVESGASVYNLGSGGTDGGNADTSGGVGGGGAGGAGGLGGSLAEGTSGSAGGAAGEGGLHGMSGGAGGGGGGTGGTILISARYISNSGTIRASGGDGGDGGGAAGV